MRLARKREIWCPTLWGWLVLLLVVAATITFIARNLHGVLALNEPVGAKVLVVEGWMDPSGLDQAIAAFRSGNYDLVITTGGPIEHWPGQQGHDTFAERAADYLKQNGLASDSVTAVPAPKSVRDRTFLSALAVRKWATRSDTGFDALDVFSLGAHARRSRLLFQLAFGPSVKVGVFAARSLEYDPGEWWKTSAGVKDVLDQTIGLIWAKCFFRALL